MLQFLIIFALLFIAVLLLGVRIFFFKKNFPNIHIGGNKHMKNRGISCYTSQDRTEQNKITKLINKNE